MTDELSTVRNILKRNQARLLGHSNVVAAGIGYKVTAGKKTQSLGLPGGRPGHRRNKTAVADLPFPVKRVT